MASTWGGSWGTSWATSWDRSGVTPTPPAVGFPAKRRRYVDLSKIKSGFSRKYFEEMRAAERSALAALKASENRKRVEQQEALEQAALAAQEAIAAASEEPEYEVDFSRLTRALDAAVSAKNFATSLKRANDAIAAANAIMNEEEEEAIMLLLSH